MAFSPADLHAPQWPNAHPSWRVLRPAWTVVAALVLAGCMSSGPQVQPLTPAPTTAVTSSSLPQPITIGSSAPTTQTLDQAARLDPTLQGGTAIETPVETVALDPALNGAEGVAASTALPGTTANNGPTLSEDDLIGVWSASTPVATCSVNLSLTSWEGGYRASTRNCADIQLASLAAWSIEGQQVLLRSGDGATLARLFRTAPTRYAGQLETGQPVTVFR